MRSRLVILAVFAASIVLAGCGEPNGGVITPEKSENPMKGATEKSGS